ncbi:MAG: undecaprenyl-diphosphate phosphatase [Clostridiales bacterium]|nr:undecaprenyl-diphosphate phosphatase [Clostridiales bacterium]
MLTAMLILVSEYLSKKQKNKQIDLNYKTAIFMGIAQGIAVMPGISRSGSTICSGLISGIKRDEVANFSFLMSIPIILASLALEIFEYASIGQALTLAWYELAIGFVVAFLTGIFAVKFMLNIIKKHSLVWFAVYLVGVSILSFFVV